MKLRLSIFIIGCILSCTFGARHYTPHKKKVEVTYTDGDKVVFLTRYTTMEVTDLYVISRNDIKYTIPTNCLTNIKRPQIETVAIKFEVMGEKYEEGTFYFGFLHGSVDKSNEEYPVAEFIFEKGIFYASFDSWYEAHGRRKMQKKHNQQVDPIVTTPVDEVEAQSTQGHP